jgi:hypothetical protein
MPSVRLVSIFVLTFTCFGRPALAQIVPRVRTVDRLIVDALDEGRRHSGTLRGLLHEIGQSDLIVHIRVAPLRGGTDGACQFVTAAGGARFVRITVRRGLPLDALTALLGHELMHAVEVARHALVRDQDSMRALYERIGERELNSYRFDTRAAVDVGRRVRLDLLDAYASQPHRGRARVTPAR